MRQTLAVIIPTLNEEARLAATLARLGPDVEVVVADGGSKDGTCAIARQHGVRLVKTAAGRARQMNAGAQETRADILLFLHADTLLPPDFQTEVSRCLAQPQAVAGAFRLELVGEARGLGLIAWGANVRARIWQLPYGDQALFMRRQVFVDAGGFAEVDLLEDVMLVRALRRQGRIVLADSAVQSSARKWQEGGRLRTTLINQLILFGFFLGLPTDLLAKIYGVRK